MRRSIVLSFPFQLVFPDETVSYWLHEVVELIRSKFWRHDIQHNDTQHKDTQERTLSITIKTWQLTELSLLIL